MTNASKKSRRQALWEKHIAQCTASGLSQVEYCRVNRLSIKSLQYWKRKVKRDDTPVLIEVPLPKPFPAAVNPAWPQLCLVMGRYRIEIDSGFESAVLERLVRTLERI